MKMLNKIVLIVATLLALGACVPSLAAAIDTKSTIQCGVNGANGTNDCTAQPTTSIDSTARTVINIISALVGVVAVIMLIIAGFKYITSGGDSNKVTSAKNTLLYALIGLVIVALAQTIAHFALTEANNPSSTSLKNPGANYLRWS